MTPKDDPEQSKDSRLEAMLAFDRALAAGDDSSASGGPGSTLDALYECQRLLEAVWPRRAPLPSSPPSCFGRFSIVRELGRGGFGVVFLAEDPILRRNVALKVPRPEVLVTPNFRRRFLREAEAASRLDHPHIVPVYEVGEEGPVCYIASAYCEGLTLAQWLRRQATPVPIQGAARLVAIVGAAVAHAHQRGILHRDLKPGNILLQRVEASGPASDGARQALGHLPRICDFGLAKLLDELSHETFSGVPIGSPDYMAPEQAAGRLREHGPATDVYALGAILYEMLAGRPPLRGETDLETLRLVSDQDPPTPRALRPGLPRDLETITLKCLDKQPARRYASAAELTTDLERFLAGESIQARPIPAWHQAARWAKRRPAHAALAVVIALATFSILSVLLWSSAWLRRHNRNLLRAVAEAKRDTQRAERSLQSARIELTRTEERQRAAQLAERSALASQVKLIHETLESGDIGLAAAMLEAHQPAPGRPAPDGFAWGYVRQLFRPEVTPLGRARRIGDPAVLKLAVSHDSRMLAAALSDGRVLLWDLIEEKLVYTLIHGSGPGEEVYYLVFSPDGRLLVTTSVPNHVRIWDLAARKERATLPTVLNGVNTHLNGIIQVRFADTSDCIAIFAQGWHDGRFQVWFWSVPAPGGQPMHRATLNQKELPSFGSDGRLKDPSWSRASEAGAPWLTYARNHLVLLDDGVTLAIKDGTGDATLFDPYHHMPTARIAAPFYVPAIMQRPFTGLNASEIGRVVKQALRVVGSVDRADRPSPCPSDVMKFSPDGRTMAVHIEGAYAGGLGVALIDVASGRVQLTNAPARWRVVDLAFTPDGRTLVVAGFDSQIHLWRLRPNALAGHPKETWSLAFSPDCKSLASAGDDHTVKLWDVGVGQERASLKGHGALVTAVAYSPDGAWVASASFDRTIRLSDAAKGKPLATLHGHTDRVRALAFSRDGQTLASAGSDMGVRLWDMVKQRQISPPLIGHNKTVHALAFAPDGETLFSGSDDKTIRVWDRASGQARAVWLAGDQVYALAISPGGQTLAVAQADGKLTVWDINRRTAHPPFRGHAGDILGVAFSPDGVTLASAGRDQTVRLWDPATGQELLTLKGHQAPVHGIAFAPDGAILATGSHDGAIKLWRAPPRVDSSDR
jgi:WD40 repeat protein/serine/threonine protein kinase